jgi:pSer/pThr/pTyr-binding forkhead associated (FHA) protein
MPVIKFSGQQFSLQAGQNRLGGGTTADVDLGPEVNGVQAIVDLGGDGRATIRKAGSDSVRVNGTELAQPSPLIHGDKVEFAGFEMYFADDAKGGSTQFVSAADVAAIAAKRSGPARGTLATGGRLVSLVDGKEYPIPESGATIGRDATADIVVAQTAVSRRHAQVIPNATGYVVNDLSTNGVFVNGEKVQSGYTLSRADVIRVGTEEFRFYADLAPMGKAAPAPAAAAAPAAAPAPAAPAPPRPAPAPASPPTPPARPATPPPAPTPAAKAPTAPARPAVPAPSAPAAAPAAPAVPLTAAPTKSVPTWVGVAIIVVIAAAIAGYFILSAN